MYKSQLYDFDLRWNDWRAYYGQPRYALTYPNVRLPHVWADDPGGRLRAVFEREREQSVALLSPGILVTTLTTQNVVAYLPGRDPTLAYETLLLTAPYDHRGAGLRNRFGATPQDTIFNGARNNATGTTALLAAAQSLAGSTLKRSILFVALGGEDLRAFGSTVFAETPPIPLTRAVLNLNAATGEIQDTSGVTLLGYARTTADAALQQAASRFDLRLLSDSSFTYLFGASSNGTFARRGIPALTFSGGFATPSDLPALRNVLPYAPSDHADAAYPYRYLLRYAQAYSLAARLLAGAPARPRWSEGDALEAQARLLYGGGY